MVFFDTFVSVRTVLVKTFFTVLVFCFGKRPLREFSDEDPFRRENKTI